MSHLVETSQAEPGPRRLTGQLSVILLVATFVLVDQVSKLMVQVFLARYQSVHVIPDFFRLAHYANYGAIGGIGQGSPATIPLLVVASLALGALILLLYRGYASIVVPSLRVRLFVALTMAPLVSHSIDRLRQGFVVDFLQIGGTPLFNLADVLPHLAIVLLVVELAGHLRQRRGRLPLLVGERAEVT